MKYIKNVSSHAFKNAHLSLSLLPAQYLHWKEVQITQIADFCESLAVLLILNEMVVFFVCVHYLMLGVNEILSDNCFQCVPLAPQEAQKSSPDKGSKPL